MDAARRPPTIDPEFDPSPGPRVRLRDSDPLAQQRVVVNPFLAVVGLVGLIRLAVGLLASSIPGLAGLLLIPLVVVPFLIQFHCLDCGATGSYPRLRRHDCPQSRGRVLAGRPSRFPFPKAQVQVILWAWALGAAAVLLTVVGST